MSESGSGLNQNLLRDDMDADVYPVHIVDNSAGALIVPMSESGLGLNQNLLGDDMDAVVHIVDHSSGGSEEHDQKDVTLLSDFRSGKCGADEELDQKDETLLSDFKSGKCGVCLPVIARQSSKMAYSEDLHEWSAYGISKTEVASIKEHVRATVTDSAREFIRRHMAD